MQSGRTRRQCLDECAPSSPPGADFIGSHLADTLLARGDSVILRDNLSTGRLENIEQLRQRDDVEFVLGRILNADLVGDVISRTEVGSDVPVTCRRE